MTSHLEAARYAQEYDECEHGVPGSAQCIDCLIRSHRDEVAALNDEAERLTSDLERARRILEDRDASLSAEEYEQRAADDAALLASPKAGEILGALEREALYERHLRWRTQAQVKRLRAANEELRLTLAAEQGKPAGAPNFAGMEWMDDVKVWRRALLRLVGGRTDHLRAMFGQEIAHAAVAWGGGDSARWDNLSAPEQAHWVADYIERAAMIAADAALSGEATTSPSAPAPQGSPTPR